jgi:hypothetical protein
MLCTQQMMLDHRATSLCRGDAAKVPVWGKSRLRQLLDTNRCIIGRACWKLANKSSDLHRTRSDEMRLLAALPRSLVDLAQASLEPQAALPKLKAPNLGSLALQAAGRLVGYFFQRAEVFFEEHIRTSSTTDRR